MATMTNHLGFPQLRFFRHFRGVSGVKAGQPFGEKYLYKWWKKACANLGIEGIVLYGGTRHSTVTALRKDFSPEQIKAGTMHSTNKAFDRYLQIQTDDALSIYDSIQGWQTGGKQKRQVENSQLAVIAKQKMVEAASTKLNYFFVIFSSRYKISNK